MYETYIPFLVPMLSKGLLEIAIAAQESALWSENYIRMRSFFSFAPEFINLSVSSFMSPYGPYGGGMVGLPINLLPYRRIRPYRHPFTDSLFFFFPCFCHIHARHWHFSDTVLGQRCRAREIRPINSRYE
jgi:hypothetical protein